MPLIIGQLLQNRYRIDALLGQGGMGAVYRAWDISLNIPVAVKENLDTSPEAQRQFLREAQMLARLSHPNLPRVSDHFSIPGAGQYLVMDFVEGEDLESMLNRIGVLPEHQVLSWILQVCDALIYLHGQMPPIIHRDVKPANIKIRADGRAMLVDFGIAKIYDARQATTMGAKAVAPGYSPPEQYSGRTDPRSDVYALGATLYTLLTGEVLPESALRAAHSAMTQPPRRLNPQIAPSIERAIIKAIDVDTAHRFRDVDELRVALTSSVVSGRNPSSLLGPIVGLMGMVVVVIVVLILTYANRRPVIATPSVTFMTPAPVVTPRLIAMTSPAPAFSSTDIPIPTPQPTNTAAPQPASLTDTPALPETLTPVPFRTRTADGAVLIYVPAGDFWMGSEDSDPMAVNTEKPQHRVYLDAFWIDRTEITVGQYHACVRTGACNVPQKSSSKTRPDYFDSGNFDDYPVLWVNWCDADKYCRWVSARLPTEAEWEKAARGSDGRIFPWGNAWDEIRVNAAGRLGDTQPVGQFLDSASPYGVLNMSGNVWEWVEDWFNDGYYAISPERNPAGPDSGSSRSIRGGSWYSRIAWQRAANRGSAKPDVSDDDIGFRCVVPEA